MEQTCQVCGRDHLTGACTESKKPASLAQQIERAFQGISGAAKEGVRDKIGEYDRRIRAAKEGKPLKSGDTPDNLLADFRRFARKDWSEDFDINEHMKGTENTPESPSEAKNTDSTPEKADPQRVNEFILKLAETASLDDDQAIGAMVKQLKLLEKDENFPLILDALDPDQHQPQTKLLGESGKQRLRSALEKYGKN